MKEIAIFFALGSLALWCQPRERPAGERPTMSFEEYDPKSTLVVPEHPKTRAKFPFIDVHNHQTRMLGDWVSKLVAEMDKLNMQVMVNLSGGYGERLKQTVEGMKRQYPDRFVVFANINFTGIDDADYPGKAAKQLEEDIANGAQGLKIFKDFGMDRKDTKGNRIPVDDPRFDKVFQVCAKHNIPVLIHTAEPQPFFQPLDKNNERWLELTQFPSRYRPPDRYPSWDTLMNEQMALFARHPKTKFINAHLGWLGCDLAELGRRLDKLPNMYTEMGAVLYELGRQPRAAKAFLTKYQDRVMMGKDIWEPSEYHSYFRVLETADEYFPYYRKRHAFWRMYGLDLPDDILKKIYYQNALKVIPGLDARKFPK
jgi:predicted TIM-barrel fold metal-dependent hydrolase